MDLVPDPEQRAVRLLASITDSDRLCRYLLTGTFRAMGNVTKIVYEIDRYDGIHKTRDGRRVGSYCLHAPNWRLIPQTDHVIAVKNLIEGEELEFRATANWEGEYYAEQGAVFMNPIPAERRELEALRQRLAYPYPAPVEQEYVLPDPNDPEVADPQETAEFRRAIEEEVQREIRMR